MTPADEKTAQAGAIALEAHARLTPIRNGGAFIAEALRMIVDTQAELARLSGLTPNTITAIKQGKRPTAAQRAAISWAIFKRWA